MLRVKWMNGKEFHYRMGLDGRYEVYPYEKFEYAPKNMDPIILKQGFQDIFLFQISKTEEGFVFYLKCLKSYVEAKNFQGTITISSNERQFRFEGPVLSYEDEMIAGLFLDHGITKMLVEKTGVLSYDIKIRNLKEEAKDEDSESGISDNND